MGESEQREIVLTPKAKSKAFRLLSERRLRELVHWGFKGRNCRVFQEGELPKFHIVGDDGVAVVTLAEPGKIIITKQMHEHADYHREKQYRRLDTLPREVNDDG